mmetsp:Transcript_11116/g.16643  ORF Transcript_11116/g.16643 Transcript_11116/m.16643 type:complete len:165 (-) Transcript_11116:49-543(-)
MSTNTAQVPVLEKCLLPVPVGGFDFVRSVDQNGTFLAASTLSGTLLLIETMTWNCIGCIPLKSLGESPIGVKISVSTSSPCTCVCGFPPREFFEQEIIEQFVDENKRPLGNGLDAVEGHLTGSLPRLRKSKLSKKGRMKTDVGKQTLPTHKKLKKKKLRHRLER